VWAEPQPALLPAAGMLQAIDTATSHLDFRCIVRQPSSPASNGVVR
jgi:hypothetical protein